MDSTLKTLSRDLEVLSVENTGLSQKILDLEKQAKEQVIDSAHLTKLEKQVSRFEKEYQKAAQTAGKIQEQVKMWVVIFSAVSFECDSLFRLHDSIMEVGGSRMQSQQKHVDAVTADIDQSNAAIAKANVGIKTAQRYCT